MTPGTPPQLKASSGVAHAVASIVTRPKGSGQAMANSSPGALGKNWAFCRWSISPTYSPPSLANKGVIICRKQASSTRGTFAAIFSGANANLSGNTGVGNLYGIGAYAATVNIDATNSIAGAMNAPATAPPTARGQVAF